jgi:polyribonucleotide nucleotidyltransferase
MAVATELGTTKVSTTVGDQEISFETGKLAKQADGAVLVRSGETMVLATAMGRMEPREGADFFPLTVDVEERMYAAGKIPGGFFKREGRPTERAILTARMIDRPIRPLWPKGYRNETQVICTVLSADLITPHDILCINGASAALMISPLPFIGPVGAVRIGLIDGELVVNPTLPQIEEETTLDLIVVGTKEGLTMVEAGAEEVPESTLLEALDIAHREIIKLCEAQEELRERAGHREGLDHQELRQEGCRGDLQAARPPQDRGRQAAPRRPQPGGDPPDHVRGDDLTAHARLGPLHARPDADPVAAHPGHCQGGPADRRPVARERPPLHAPLQLPAVLGR